MFYKNINIKEYAAISPANGFLEIVYLSTGDQLLDITAHHWVLCLDPMTVGIWLNNNQVAAHIIDNPRLELLFYERSQNDKPPIKLAQVTVSYSDRIEERDGTLLLLKVKHCRLYHTSILETLLLFQRYYHKPKINYKKFKSFVAAFSFPRKVRLISFKNGTHYNIFPMDLMGKIDGTNRFVLGLRHSNQTLSHIMDSKKLVVSEIPSSHKDAIYELGSHHSSAPPPLESLPFKTVSSKVFGFPVPEWAVTYNELTIQKTKNLGSQMLLWAESQNEIRLNIPSPHFYHIHFLLHLFQQRHSNTYHLA